MAERPIFIPAPDSPELVKELSMHLVWNPGFAPVQKRKNVAALHASSAKAGYAPLLEVSTKSEEKVGQRLSAFNLKVHSDRLGKMPLETAFQGSKVFARGGPYTDLYTVPEVRDAKRDWLYVTALYEHREWLRNHILRYAGFTDIEFNPERSINCQARSCALLVTLMKNDWLDEAVGSPGAFIRLLSSRQYRPDHARSVGQEAMFQP